MTPNENLHLRLTLAKEAQDLLDGAKAMLAPTRNYFLAGACFFLAGIVGENFAQAQLGLTMMFLEFYVLHRHSIIMKSVQSRINQVNDLTSEYNRATSQKH